MKVKQCSVCGGGNLREYLYNNHTNKLIFLAKTIVANLLFSTLKYLGINYYIRFIFSRLMTVYHCSACGHGKLDIKISEENLLSYYSYRFWDTVGIDLKKNDIRGFGQHAFVIDYIKNERSRVLEIGAGAASMLKLLRKENPTALLDVVEPGIQWDSNYKEHSINKVSSFFPWKTSILYDYVHTSHWLEHVLDIDSVILSIKGILKKNGYLFIEVPNTNRDYWSLDIKDVPHINFFTKQSLKHLMENHGFNVVKIDEYGYRNREFYESVIRGGAVDSSSIYEADQSIRKSIYRKDGNIIRGLFKAR